MIKSVSDIKALEEKAYKDHIIYEDCIDILTSDNAFLFDLIASANRIRYRYKGDKVSLCSIINAKSGGCKEDCAFCAQSVHNQAAIDKYPLLEDNMIIDAAKEAVIHGAHKFGIVTSGKGIEDDEEFSEICGTVNKISRDMHCCASLGVLSREEAIRLKEAGLKEYHHNLETAESFFGEICSTRSYEENIGTVKTAKEAGLRVCCGGIFGMGEKVEQRVELAITLKKLGVDSIPLNFLNPIKGTRLFSQKPLRPFDILKIIIMFRFLHQDRDIKVAGGREANLRDIQSFIFAAGANSTMVGNYLTTKGRNYEEDLKMIEDLDLTIED